MIGEHSPAGAATAAVWHGPDDGFRLTPLPLPSLAPGEVLVETGIATLCGSDLHTVAGDRDTPLPTILGHEMVGTVVAVNGTPRTTTGATVEPGMRVTWSIGASCGRCRRCRRGLPQKCTALRKYGHAALDDGWQLSGGLASHCHLLAGTGIVEIPPELPDQVAAPANCATATIVHAVRAAAPRPEDVVVVQGCGMLGLTAIAYLRGLGVATVVASDPDPERLHLARRCGATADVSPVDLAEAVRARSDGEGADVVLDVSGSSTAVQHALDEVLAIGGRLVLVGSVFPAPPLRVDPEQVVRRLATIRGVHNYVPDDLTAAVRFLAASADHEVLASFVPVTYPLDRLEDAIAQATTRRPPRVGIDPHPVS
ncbi:MAG TPA: zinc-binding dehydrogenase [Actinopolymorphaceae bacterium]